MLSTMMDFPLTVQHIFRHGRRTYGNSQIVTWTGAKPRRASFAAVAGRAERLAAALQRLGVGPGDRVGTLQWNNQEHFEAYLAVPCMGAVLHTLNLRLFPDQLAYVVNHGEDKVVIVDDSLIPVLARVRDRLTTVERIVVAGSGDASALGDGGDRVLRYEELIGAETPGFAWPELDERAAAAMCYTTGTTGDPKGVAYSHRSIFLHTLGVGQAAAVPLTEKDRVLPIVPMFHALSWGLPYLGWSCGTDFVMPGPFLQAEPLARMIAAERVTYAAAVPAILNDLLRYAEKNETDLSSLRMVMGGGAAVPRALIERFHEKTGVWITQGWGMTETSPVAALAWPPRGTRDGEQPDWCSKTGRVFAGVEMRIVDDEGNELPWDGQAVGEIEVRGPWVTGSYYKNPAPERFHDGWLRTGDVGSVDPLGFIQITDRAKDVIKSGGEWISSVELENHLMGHPDVVEAAVIGVPDLTWDERPLACVVLKEGAARDAEALRRFLCNKVAGWWLPERWTFIPEIPRTSVGKFDKKVLRARYADGELEVVELAGAKR
ncbi:MAG TPA: long-chain fatty acid--CoA ligase [Thermoanaerobaculia bacterium]|nr:long-chain fatty acid--CoA ligase [Thermoanaerobaculia bacterium]